jgi:very-short-patch-repair endonuclease
LRLDHERDAQAARVGWQTLRFLYEQISESASDVVATVVDVRRVRAQQLGRRAG